MNVFRVQYYFKFYLLHPYIDTFIHIYIIHSENTGKTFLVWNEKPTVMISNILAILQLDGKQGKGGDVALSLSQAEENLQMFFLLVFVFPVERYAVQPTWCYSLSLHLSARARHCVGKPVLFPHFWGWLAFFLE